MATDTRHNEGKDGRNIKKYKDNYKSIDWSKKPKKKMEDEEKIELRHDNAEQ